MFFQKKKKERDDPYKISHKSNIFIFLGMEFSVFVQQQILFINHLKNFIPSHILKQ